MLARSTSIAEDLLNEAQPGFTEGHGTVEQISNIRLINEKYIAHQRYVYHNFIYFQKAFDRVWHEALWKTMLKHNVRTSMISVMKSLYDHAKNAVLIGEKNSSWFRTNVGVRQGCVLSPTLFDIFFKKMMIDTLGSFISGVKIGCNKSAFCG